MNKAQSLPQDRPERPSGARLLAIAAVQASGLSGPDVLDRFEQQLDALRLKHPDVDLVVYPECHLCGASSDAQLRAYSETLAGPRTARLGALARKHGVWLVPGTVCETGEAGELFNTALVFAPDGALVASYRKAFPWRPSEIYDCGTSWTVFGLGDAQVGLSICYDIWWPEVARQLAWLGAELIVTPFRTTTGDRAQELVLARATGIVNQLFVICVNAARPGGVGQSIVVGPEGEVIAQSVSDDEEVLCFEIDLDRVKAVRALGTAGVTRPWSQPRATDRVLPLPAYGGRLDPASWEPARGGRAR